MITTSYSQTCLCGRSFDNAGAFTRHKNTCSRGRKRLANALSHAKESYRTKKCRVEGIEENVSSSQTERSRVISHTADGVLGDTSGVSDPVRHLMGYIAAVPHQRFERSSRVRGRRGMARYTFFFAFSDLII